MLLISKSHILGRNKLVLFAVLALHGSNGAFVFVFFNMSWTRFGGARIFRA